MAILCNEQATPSFILKTPQMLQVTIMLSMGDDVADAIFSDIFNTADRTSGSAFSVVVSWFPLF